MKESFVPVFFDEKTLSSTQYLSALSGLRASAGKAGKRVELFPIEHPESLDPQDFPDECVLISVSTPLILHAVSVLRSLHKTAILSGIDGEQFGSDVSSVTPSRRSETRQLVHYLYHAGRERIALLGFGMDSLNDTFRYHAAMTAADVLGRTIREEDSFRWREDPAESFDAFFPLASRYDAVLCPNDMIAVAFLSECKKRGFSVPHDFYLASFGNTALGSYCRPTLTTLSMDMYRVGQESFKAWQMLENSGAEERAALKITVPGRILVRESTENTPVQHENAALAPALSDDRFYHHPLIASLVGLDACLSARDALDFRILRALFDKESYDTISERCFISPNALRYRLKKIYQDAGCRGKKEFEALVHEKLGEGNPFAEA